MNTVIILSIMIQPGVWKDYILYNTTHEMCQKTELLISKTYTSDNRSERSIIRDMFKNGGSPGMIYIGCHQ